MQRILFFWYCDQNGTVHTWHPCICKMESSSCDTVIRMEQYIPDTTAYVSCSILITVSQEGDSNVRFVLFHSGHSNKRRGWYYDQNETVHTWHPCISKLESSSCCTVIRMEQYITDTPAYVIQYHKKGILNYICRGVRYVLFHSDHSITRRGFQLTYCRSVRYVLFHSDHSITRRAFQLTYAVVSGMYCSNLITV
jgi:hypothetical protein